MREEKDSCVRRGKITDTVAFSENLYYIKE